MQLDILAIGAHPDDVELFAGGTMAKMAALGYSTGVVDMTRGELGTRGTPALRAKESRAAAEILGLKIRDNLKLEDGNVSVTPESRLKVIRALRKYRPQIVLTHYWMISIPIMPIQADWFPKLYIIPDWLKFKPARNAIALR